jgi:holo-[acyl-carrier protein] synthase
VVYGIGTDIIEVDRVGALVSKGPGHLNHVFTPREIEFCESKRNKNQHYAARFAAKEAFMKALGTGWNLGIAFTQIEVVPNQLGKPEIVLHGKALEFAEREEIIRIHLSITHIKELANAIVIIET